MLYLDHASTSFPKAPGVGEAMINALESAGSPNRGGHDLAAAGDDIVHSVRNKVAALFSIDSPGNVIFTPGATYALNLAIKGLKLLPEDHVIATCFDHNSVLRPLEQLRARQSVGLTIVESRNTDGRLLDKVRQSIRPRTRLLTLNHASNVTGAILPFADLIELAHSRGIPVLLDASQSVGNLPISSSEVPADLIAFGAHKALLGPPGLGCLIIVNNNLQIFPEITGGTGYNSQSLAPEAVYPVSLEPGTANVPAIAGFGAALDFLNSAECRRITGHTAAMREVCLDELRSLPRVRLYSDVGPSVPVIAFTLEGISPELVSTRLSSDYQIYTRAGLHCAPMLHHVLGTGRTGLVRVSFGYGVPSDAVDQLLAALRDIIT